MPEPRVLLVLNPQAGSASELDALVAALAARPGISMVRSAGPGEVGRLAREAAERGVPRIAAAGGDGTMHELLEGVSGRLDRVELGLLPLGTGNDLARSLGIPSDPREALALLEEGPSTPVDVIRLTAEGVRLVLNASAGGFSAKVSENMEPAAKEALGPLAYPWTALTSLGELEAHRLVLDADGERLEIEAAYALVVANGRTIAGGIPVAPDAVLDDGLADVLVVPALPALRMAALAPRLLQGTHVEAEDLVVRRVRTLRVEADPPFPLNADGEPAGTTPATFEVLRAAVRVVHGDPPAGALLGP